MIFINFFVDRYIEIISKSHNFLNEIIKFINQSLLFFSI